MHDSDSPCTIYCSNNSLVRRYFVKSDTFGGDMNSKAAQVELSSFNVKDQGAAPLFTNPHGRNNQLELTTKAYIRHAKVAHTGCTSRNGSRRRWEKRA